MIIEMHDTERKPYFGSPKDIKRNVILYFLDGVTFMPAAALIFMATVIPFFLEQLSASTTHFAIAAATITICSFVAQPIFGSIASRTRLIAKTFAKILFAHRLVFLGFVLCMPLFASNHILFIWVFLFFWAVFNLFANSGMVFNAVLVLKLLPPEKRAGMRGVGFATGNMIALGVTALIPWILGGFSFPYNFMIIFSIGLFFLMLNAAGFWLMKEHEDIEPRIPMSVIQSVKGIPISLKEDATFRSMILTCMFLVVANSLIPFYTLYAIRVFSASEAQIALLATLAISTGIFINIVFGFIIDRKGPVKVSPLAGAFVILAGVIALGTNSMNVLYVAWVLAHLGSGLYNKTTMLMLGDVSPAGKVPLYVSVLFTISMALSSLFVLLLGPVLENVGFVILFIIVITCGSISLCLNLFVFQRLLAKRINGSV